MSDQITLLDVCKLPDVQIHSKSSLFKYIVSKEKPEMKSIRDNIVKLSYTNKVIGVRGQQVGIFSKRLPLKFKQNNAKWVKDRQNPQLYYSSNYVANNNFYAAPLQTVKKQKQIKPDIGNSKQFLSIETYKNHLITESENLKSNIGNFKGRAKSMAKLRIYAKKQEIKIQDGSQLQNINEKNRLNNRRSIIKKTRTAFNPQNNRKSYSHLLKEVNNDETNWMINPINHEDNVLFKKFKKINQITRANRIMEQNQASFEGRYADHPRAVTTSRK